MKSWRSGFPESRPASSAPEGGGDDEPYDPARALRLFGDRRPAAAQAPGRGAARVLDHRQLRGLGYFSADGPPGAAGADRGAAAPRRAELELARIRHAGRRLALLRALFPA